MTWIREQIAVWPIRRACWIRRLSQPVVDRIGPRLGYLATTPEFPAIPDDTVTAAGYSSQIGQDLVLDRHVFDRQRDGVFVDVGAHNGVEFSNTLFFERQRGWTGVCIEPHPSVFPELAAQRTATCVQTAVGVDRGPVPFQAIDGPSMLSGFVRNHDRQRAARFDRLIQVDDATVDIIDVEVKRLDDILADVGVDRIDLLSIDVEGAELDVLRSIVLRDFGVRAVIIENNFRSFDIPRAMRSQGYQLMLRLAWDELYVPIVE